MLKRNYKPVLYLLVVVVLLVTIAIAWLNSSYVVLIVVAIIATPFTTRFNTVAFTKDGLLVQNMAYRRKQRIPYQEIRKISLYTEKYFYKKALSFNVYYYAKPMKTFHIGLVPATEIPRFNELLPKHIVSINSTEE